VSGPRCVGIDLVSAHRRWKPTSTDVWASGDDKGDDSPQADNIPAPSSARPEATFSGPPAPGGRTSTYYSLSTPDHLCALCNPPRRLTEPATALDTSDCEGSESDPEANIPHTPGNHIQHIQRDDSSVATGRQLSPSPRIPTPSCSFASRRRPASAPLLHPARCSLHRNRPRRNRKTALGLRHYRDLKPQPRFRRGRESYRQMDPPRPLHQLCPFHAGYGRLVQEGRCAQEGMRHPPS
jgi:hypothetical protein